MRRIILFTAFFLMALAAIAQMPQVRGTVLDEQGKPIQGVTITLRRAIGVGTSDNVVITDKLGGFTVSNLDIRQSDTYDITFSYSGYSTYIEKNIRVNDSTTVVISIGLTPQSKELSDVVVTALGIERQPKSLGYSTQRVKGEEFENTRNGLNLANVMIGKVSGLEINGSTEMLISSDIRLRGVTPLIVVDGAPTNTSTWNLNFNDIESVDVLKGSTAAALFGSRGINGAILITLKKGKSNRVKVEYSTTNITQPSLITSPKVQTEYGSGAIGKYEYVNGSGVGIEGGGFTWGPKLDGRLIKQWNSPIDPITGQRVPIPWVDHTGGKGNLSNFLRTGFVNQNNLNFEAGNEKGSFRVSLSQGFQLGIVPNTKMSTYGFSIGAKYDISPKLQVNTTLNYSKVSSPNYRIPRYGTNDYIYSLSFWLGADIDLEDSKNYWDPAQVGTKQRFQQTGYYNNPYFIAYQNINRYDNDALYGQVSGDYTFIPKELTLKLRVGGNSNMLGTSEKIPVGYTGVPLGNYSISNNRSFTINNDAILTYSKKISKNLSVDAIGGASYYYNQNDLSTLSTDGLVTQLIYNMTNSRNPVRASNTILESQTKSLFANLDFKFWEPLYLSLTGRNDWVSTLPVNANSYFYPSASLSLVLSDWLNLPKSINFLKIRSSIAQVNTGNTGSTYGQVQTYPVGVYNNMPTMSAPRSLISNNLLPGASRTFEIGANASFLDNRLSFDLTYFNRLDYDNIISQTVSITTGYNSVIANGRKNETRGLELSLNTVPVRRKNFKWFLDMNIFRFHTYLKEMENGLTRNGYVEINSRVDQIYARPILRNPEGEMILASNGLNQLDPFLRHTGNFNPDFMYGIQSRLVYKDFTLSFTFDGRSGGKYFSILPRMVRAGTSTNYDPKAREDAANGLVNYVGKGVLVTSGTVTYDGLGNIIKDTRTYAPNTTPVNYEAWAKSIGNISGGRSESFLDADYLKLRTVSLGWIIPKRILGKKIGSGELSIFGENLLLFANSTSWGDDPSWIVGIESQNASLKSPTARSFGLQLRFTF